MNEKLKLMIVDDEYLERILIEKSFDYISADILVSAACENGLEGLESFQKSPVDIVLADIEMPIMNGLEMAKQIKAIAPITEIIIISGFSEFRFAQKGIEIGVSSYLLKPINAQELAEAVTNAKTRILAAEKYGNTDTIQISNNRDKNSDKFPETIKKVIDYIDEHYTDADLSLGEVAKLVFTNESYLSRTFKQYCNKTFKEYLTAKRMEKAKVLALHTALKTHEIAERTGYSDPNYFGQCFKAYTGKTINQFRQ